MAEHRLFPAGTVPYVSTLEFHEPRARAPHLEQDMHTQRLQRCAWLIHRSGARSVVDLANRPRLATAHD